MTKSPSMSFATVTLLVCALLPFGSALAIGDFGPDTCAEGFVWREACGPGDHVCVTPNIRTQAVQDNAQAASRRQPGGGSFGPDTCKQGFVWREACGPSDHVCVPPATRSEAGADSSQASHRLKYPVCQEYAQAAVAANQQNLAKHCGFSGLRWQSDSQVHFKWCLNAAAQPPIQEANARNQQLAACSQPQTCTHCNDGSCQCGIGSKDELCTGHGGNDPLIGCVQQP
jgi:hypothetical protein